MIVKEKEYQERKDLPANPLDPFFYHVYENTLPAEQYYRLIPEGKLIILDKF